MQDKIVRQINKCLERLQNNERSALEELFSLTKEHLRRVAVYYLFDKSLADDVLSEAYLNVIKYCRNFDKGKNGYNWLYQIVKNLTFDFNKYRSTHPTVEILETDAVVFDYTETLVDIISVQRAIKNLDKTEQMLIHKLYWEQKSLRKIAAELDIPYMTLSDRVKKIIKKLEEILN